MKNISSEEIYILSAIADKMDLDFEMPSTKGKTKEQLEELQTKVGKKIMVDMFKKLHKAKKEVDELIKALTGKEAKEMSLIEIKDTITEILKQDGILDFFK